MKASDTIQAGSTITFKQFATLMGIGERKFLESCRRGAIPRPLDPGVKRAEQIRWSLNTAQAFVAGKYTGLMYDPAEVPPPRMPPSATAKKAAVGRPRKAQTVASATQSNKEPSTVTEGRVPVKTRKVFDLSNEDIRDESKIAFMMPDGTIRTLNLKS